MTAKTQSHEDQISLLLSAFAAINPRGGNTLAGQIFIGRVLAWLAASLDLTFTYDALANTETRIETMLALRTGREPIRGEEPVVYRDRHA